MAIPSTGQVSLNTVKTEFGDPNSDGQFKLSEYYRDGDNDPIPNSQTSIPASNQISLGNFRGTSNITEVYYVRKGQSNTDLSFTASTENQEFDSPAFAVAEITYKVVQSGTSIQIYAWDGSMGDYEESYYYTAASPFTQTDLAVDGNSSTPYTSNGTALLIYSNAVGTSSGYNAYYTITNISGTAPDLYPPGYSLTPATNNSAGQGVTSSGQGVGVGMTASVTVNDSDSADGTSRITWTFFHSSYPTHTAKFVQFLSAQAESEEDDCPECCVHTDMLLHTPAGEYHVSQLHIGSEVYSYNFETGEKVIDKIIRKRLVRRNNEVKVNNLKMTADHPVYLQNGRLASFNPEETLSSYNMDVDQLVIGDKMMTANGELETIEQIEQLEGNQPNFTLYTENGNFYASPNGDNPILVDSVIQGDI